MTDTPKTTTTRLRRALAASTVGLAIIAAGTSCGARDNSETELAQPGVATAAAAETPTTTTIPPTTTTTAPLVKLKPAEADRARSNILMLQLSANKVLSASVPVWECLDLSVDMVEFSVGDGRWVGGKPPTADAVLNSHLAASVPALENGAQACSDGLKKMADGKLSNVASTMAAGELLRDDGLRQIEAGLASLQAAAARLNVLTGRA